MCKVITHRGPDDDTVWGDVGNDPNNAAVAGRIYVGTAPATPADAAPPMACSSPA